MSVEATQNLPLSWEGFDEPQALTAERSTSLREQALLGRSEVARALADYDARDIELRLQVRAQYPQITLGPGYTYDHGVKKLNINAGLSIPTGNKNQVAQADARRSAAGAQLEVAQGMVLGEIDAASATLSVALQALAQARQQQTLAAQVADRTGAGFRAGNDDRVSWLSVRVVADNAGLAMLTALDESQTALGNLESALRMPLSTEELALMTANNTAGKTP